MLLPILAGKLTLLLFSVGNFTDVLLLQIFVIVYLIFYSVTVCYFALSALDLLDGLHLVSEKKREIVDWIYSLQVADKGKHDYCILK